MSAERFLITGGAGFIGETGLAGNRLPRAARLVNLTVVSLYDSRDFVSKSDADHGCGATLVVPDAELVSLMIVSLPVDRDVVLLSETDLAVGALSLVMALIVDTQLACLTIVSLPDKRAAISRCDTGRDGGMPAGATVAGIVLRSLAAVSLPVDRDFVS